MNVSYEINILCESDNFDGCGASGIFTSSPLETANLVAAVEEAERVGWRIDKNPANPKDFTLAICPDCIALENSPSLPSLPSVKETEAA